MSENKKRQKNQTKSVKEKPLNLDAASFVPTFLKKPEVPA